MALDKFFCKVPETKVTDKQIEFHSEREANEYCRENGIDPHNVILMGDKYIIKTKDSDFRTTMDEAIKVCDENLFSSIERAFDKFCSHALEKTNGDPKVVAAQIDFATKMYNKCLDDLEKSYLSVKKDYDITKNRLTNKYNKTYSQISFKMSMNPKGD